MGKWKIYTPEGVSDILFEDCYLKKNLEQGIRDLLRKGGYFEVESPTIEFFDVFYADSESTPQEMMFKFFDQQGRILVLRPDLTVPVARIAATKYREQATPQKYFYIGNSFKHNEHGGGRQKEYTQAGAELFGLSTPEADAEIIATAINAVKATGLENFQIDIGQVEFFKGIMEELGLSVQEMEQMRVLIDSKDFLGLELMVNEREISSDLKGLVLSLPGFFGSVDVLERAEKITKNQRSLNAIYYIRKVLDLLSDYGFEKYVSIDLGMVQSINYYTGIIFRGFTFGIGFPILSGGRYDNLVEKFGKKSPAVGFSINLNLTMMAIERQKLVSKSQGIDTLVCYSNKGRKVAFNICSELRNQGLVAETCLWEDGLEAAKEYAKEKEIGGIIYIKDEQVIEVHDLTTGEIKETTIDQLLG